MFKFLVLLFAVAAATKLGADAPALSQELVDSINNGGNTWKASLDQGPMFDGITIAQAKGLMGAWTLPKSILPERNLDEVFLQAPASFDSQANWPNCKTIDTIRDQSACGSCWAVAAAEAMSDRYCTILGTQDPKYQSVQISAGDLMSCCNSCGSGCEGGFPQAAWAFWKDQGLPNIQCDAYPFPKCEHHIPAKNYPACPKATFPTPQCNATCDSTGAKPTLYYGSSAYSVTGIENYQKEIMENGPIEVTFSVYSDFLAYKGGVYKHTGGEFLGGHAVKMVGWGVDNSTNTPYWVINNSWNKDWGMNGQFWIERGTNQCGIEESGSAGMPKSF